MPALTRPGWYVCNVTEWGLREAKDSQAVSVALKLITKGEWNGTEWIQTPEADTFGDFYLFKRDGSLNQSGIDQLARSNCYDAEYGLMLYDTQPPATLEVVVQVEADTYNGKTRFKASWIHPADHTPGSGAIANRASRERLMELQAAAGAMLRAAVKPKPVAREAAREPVSAPAPAPATKPDDTPF